MKYVEFYGDMGISEILGISSAEEWLEMLWAVGEIKVSMGNTGSQ